MDSLDLLQDFVAEREGSLLPVNHDRELLDRLVTSVIVYGGDGDRVIAGIAAPAAETAARACEPFAPDLSSRSAGAFVQQCEQRTRRRAAVDAAKERWPALAGEAAQGSA